VSLKIEVFRLTQTLDALYRLPPRVQDRPMRKALSAAGGVIKRAARAYVRRETGLLDKSLIVKVTIPASNYRGNGQNKPAYAVVGASRRVVGPALTIGGVTKKLSTRRAVAAVLAGVKVQTRRPSRYLHLVEKGHGGPRPAPPHPFLSTAVATVGAYAQAVAIQKLQEGILEEAAKLYSP
jgi:hypothetical protein